MKYNKRSVFLLLIILVLSRAKTNAQEWQVEAEIELAGFGSTGSSLPFWFHSNSHGIISEETNAAAVAEGAVTYIFKNGSFLQTGATLVATDNAFDEQNINELYLHYENSWFYLTAGSKRSPLLYKGLSATNENILWSLNARPLPGLEIGTTEPIFLFTGVGFEATWAEYLLEEERHVKDAKVHHKSLHLVLVPQEDWLIKVGIEHFAQWGGTSRSSGKQPEDLTDYLRIVTGRAGGDNAAIADQANALGNHLGSWTAEIKKDFEAGSLTIIYNNLFEDGSGSRFANFPDGRYGLFWENKQAEGLVNSLMYEYYDTRDQSGTGPHKYDDYLNNNPIYNSGWTFHEQVLGAPFFLYDEERDRVENNKFYAHHFGVTGNLGQRNSHPYRLLLTYVHNEGSYRRMLEPSEKKFSSFLSTRIFNAGFDHNWPKLTFDLLLAADISSLNSPNFGAGVGLKYKVMQ